MCVGEAGLVDEVEDPKSNHGTSGAIIDELKTKKNCKINTTPDK